MTRRSAFAIAGGVVGAVVSTVTAFSIGLQARTAQLIAARTSAPAPHQQKPIVRTKTRTITVHRKAGKDSGGPSVVHVVPPPPPPPSTSVAPTTQVPPATTSTGGSHPGGTASDDGESEHGDD